MPGKKSTKSKKSSDEVKKVSSESDSNNVNSEDVDVDEVNDWVHESNKGKRSYEQRERKPSVFHFDRDDVAKLESKKVSELSSEELLKVVVRRGEQEKNPVLSGGCGRVLKQINGERLAPRRMSGRGYRGSFNRGGVGRGDYGRGNNRGRGSNNPRYHRKQSYADNSDEDLE
jgi:hypothetical protein